MELTDRTHPAETRSTLWPQLCWLVISLSACAHFAFAYISRCPQFLNLPVYAAGTDRLPYQGRILMSWVLRYTAGSPRGAALLGRAVLHVPPPFNDSYLLVLLATALIGTIVTVFATRSSILHLTGNRAFASWASLIALYMAYFNLLLIYGQTYTLPYDVPALAFFSLGVCLVLKQQYWLLIPVFILGTLNRETFCFLTVFLLLYAWFSSRSATGAPGLRSSFFRRALPHVALQAVLWIALRLWVRHLLKNNVVEGNGFFANQLTHNLRFLFNPPQWPLFLSICGFTIPLFFWGYKLIADRALARSVAITLGLWALAMMIVGIIVEIRIFNELTAFLTPAIALILWHKWIEPAASAGPSSRTTLTPA